MGTIAIENKTVGKLVAEDYRKAKIFKKFGIDFCCGGGVSIDKACEVYGADKEKVLSDLEMLDLKDIDPDIDYNNWPLEKLLNHIIESHHTYVREAIPIVSQFVTKVKNVHGDNKPNVAEIADIFNAVAEELHSHLEKEEKILFPYLRHLLAAEKGEEFIGPHFREAKNPIGVMLAEHEDAGDALMKIQELTNDYNPPKGACATHQVSYAYLKEFFEDLVQHVHLENNILFPKIISLENKLRSI